MQPVRTHPQCLVASSESDGIVATARHCTPDRTTAVRSVCNSLQLLLYSTNAPVSRVSSTLRGTEHARESRPVTPRVTVKYRGGKPRGFTVLTARPRTGRAVAGEFNSPRPSQNGSAGIYTRTLGASVRVGGSTPPDNTRRTCRSRVLRGVAFSRNCRQLLRITVFNPRHNCVHQYGGMRHIAYAIHPRGQAPRHSRCISVKRTR